MQPRREKAAPGAELIRCQVDLFCEPAYPQSLLWVIRFFFFLIYGKLRWSMGIAGGMWERRGLEEETRMCPGHLITGLSNT